MPKNRRLYFISKLPLFVYHIMQIMLFLKRGINIEMRKTIRGIWNGITSVLVVLIVILACLLWGFRLLKMEAFVIQSGSMEPEYPVGSVIYVKEIEPAQLRIGDVISFRLDGSTIATHRIIQVQDNGFARVFTTKGDANTIVDSTPVDESEIIGKVVFCIPQLGYLVAYLQQPSGLYAAIAVISVFLLMIILPDLIFAENKLEEKK